MNNLFIDLKQTLKAAEIITTHIYILIFLFFFICVWILSSVPNLRFRASNLNNEELHLLHRFRHKTVNVAAEYVLQTLIHSVKASD